MASLRPIPIPPLNEQASALQNLISALISVQLSTPNPLSQKTCAVGRNLLERYENFQLGRNSSDVRIQYSRLSKIFFESLQRTARHPIIRWAFLKAFGLLPIFIAALGIGSQIQESLILRSNGAIPPLQATNTTDLQFVGSSDRNAYSFLMVSALAWFGLLALAHIFSAYDQLKDRFNRVIAMINIALRAAFFSAALWVGYHFAIENELEAKDLGTSFILSIILGSVGSVFLALFRAGLVNPREPSERLRVWDHVVKIGYSMIVLLILKVHTVSDSAWCGSILVGEMARVFARLPVFDQYAQLALYTTVPFLSLFLIGVITTFVTQMFKYSTWAEAKVEVVDVQREVSQPASIFESLLKKYLNRALKMSNFQLSDLNYQKLADLLNQTRHFKKGRLNQILNLQSVREFLSLLVNGLLAMMLYLAAQSLFGLDAVYSSTTRQDCVSQTMADCTEGDYIPQACEPILREPEYAPTQLVAILIFKRLGLQLFSLLLDLCQRIHHNFRSYQSAGFSMILGACFGLFQGLLISGFMPVRTFSLATGSLVGLGVGFFIGASIFILMKVLHLKRLSLQLLHTQVSWWKASAVLIALGMIRWNLPISVAAIDTSDADFKNHHLQMRRDLLIPLILESFMWSFLVIAALQVVWTMLEMKSAQPQAALAKNDQVAQEDFQEADQSAHYARIENPNRFNGVVLQGDYGRHSMSTDSRPQSSDSAPLSRAPRVPPRPSVYGHHHHAQASLLYALAAQETAQSEEGNYAVPVPGDGYAQISSNPDTDAEINSSGDDEPDFERASAQSERW